MVKKSPPAKKKSGQPELGEQFSATFHINPDPVALSDGVTARRILVNPAFEKWSGYSKEELIGATVEQLLAHPEDRERILTEFRNNNGLSDLEIQMRRKDGEIRDTLFSVIFIEIGGEKYLFSRIHDITERNKAKGKIAQAARDWQSTFDSITDLVSIQDGDYKIVRVNKAYADALQKKPEELAGRLCYEVVHRASCPVENCPHKMALNTKTTTTSELFEPSLGAYLEVTCSPIFNERGEVEGTIHIAKDITQRKQAEQAHLEQERTRNTMISNLPGFIYRCANDHDWTMVYISDGCLPVTGYTPGDFVGNRTLAYNDIVHPDYRELLWEKWQELLKNREIFEEEYPIITKNGETRWVWERGQGVFSEDGQLLFLEGFITDVTSRREAEKALSESEERFRNMANLLPQTIFETDEKGNFTFVNSKGFEMFGYDQADLDAGINVRETIIPEDRDRALTNMSQRISGKDLPSQEYTAIRKNGRRFPAAIYASPIVLDSTYAGMRGILVDITERKRAEQAVRESEEKFKNIVEHISDVFYMLGADYRMLYVSPQAEKALGYPVEEVKKNWRLYATSNPINLAAREKTHLAFTTGEKQEPYLQEFMHSNGTPRLVEINESPLKNDKGEVTGIVGVARDVTDSRKADEMIRASEAQYRLLSDHTTDFIWLMDMDLVPTYQSPSVEKLTGFTIQEVAELPFEKRIAPGSLQAAAELFLKELPLVQADPGYNPVLKLELEYYRKDGTTAWSENKFSVLRDGSGKPVSIMGEARDISERKQVEETLRSSEERFAAAFNINPDPTAITVAATGQFIDVNPAYEKWSGFSRDELIGRTSPSLNFWVNPADRDAFVNRLRNRGAVEDMELTFRVRNGELRDTWFTARTASIGGVECLVTRAHDVTERNRMLAALREREITLRGMLDATHERACLLDTHGTILAANTAFAAGLGKDISELIGTHSSASVPAEVAAVRNAYLNRAIQSGEPVYFEDTRGGRYFSTTFYPIANAAGAVEQIAVFSQDVTDRRHLLEEQQRVAKLESVGLLAGGIAHDFNNILTAILGNISLARMEAAPGSELSVSLEQAEKASQRARDLTQQLLTFSRGGAPVTKLASLADLLKETVGFALRGSNVKCQLHIPTDLWHAEIDIGQVSQVIHNLVINAQQAMPAGGAIDLRAENMAINEAQSLGKGLPIKAGNYVRVSLTDHGSGIDAQHLDKIFDPFFTTKQKGSGLGLATSFSIARQHGGHLSVESEPGAGSTFFLYLPASPETVAPVQDKKAAIKAAGRARILVMDDEQGVREVAGRMLSNLGYRDTGFAADGAEAVRLYKAAMHSGRPFTAAILDLTIAGGMGGRETVSDLLKLDPGVRAIVSSGYADDPVIAKYRDYGFSAMVAKPYTLEQLGRALRSVIG